MQTKFSSVIRYAFALAIGMMTHLLAQADEFYSSYGVGVRSSYDDNINGSKNDPQSATAQIVSPFLKTNWDTENSTTDVDMAFDFYRYNRAGYDTDNQRIGLNNSWSYTETQQLSVEAQLVRDSTSTSEAQLQDTGVSTIERISERRIQKNFSPSWAWQFTEQDSFNLGYRYSNVDYGDAADLGYTGSDDSSVTPSISHSFREDWNVFLQTDYSVSNTDEKSLSATYSFQAFRKPYVKYSTETTTKGIAVGSNYQLLESWALKGYIGKNTSDGEYDVKTISEIAGLCEINNPLIQSLRECQVLNSLKDYSANGAYANISLNWSAELWDAALAYNSNVSPSSDGYSQQSDRWSLNSTYELTEKQSLVLTMAYVDNSVVDQNTQSILGINKDKQISIASISWSYRFAERWSVSVIYDRFQNDYPKSGNANGYTITSETISMGINWRPEKIVWAN